MGMAMPNIPTRAKLRRVQRKLCSRFSLALLQSSMNLFLFVSIPPPIFFPRSLSLLLSLFCFILMLLVSIGPWIIFSPHHPQCYKLGVWLHLLSYSEFTAIFSQNWKNIMYYTHIKFIFYLTLPFILHNTSSLSLFKWIS